MTVASLAAGTAPAGLHKTGDPALLGELLRVEGYCILPQRLPTTLVAELRAAVEPLIAASTPKTAGFRDRRFFFTMDDVAPYRRPEVWARPEVLALVRAALGPETCLNRIGMDVNLPGSSYQPSHMDCGYLYPESALALPAHSINLAIPLVDLDEEIGPMELWPCTNGNLRDADQDALVPYMHSVKPALPAGSLLLRDVRTWHRGTPNRSQRIRPQITISYHRRWFRGPHARFPAAEYDRLPDDLRGLVERGS